MDEQVQKLLSLSPNLKFFAIFFGSGNAPQLEVMAKLIPGGSFARSLDAEALQQDFVEIAQTISSVSYVWVDSDQLLFGVDALSWWDTKLPIIIKTPQLYNY